MKHFLSILALASVTLALITSLADAQSADAPPALISENANALSRYQFLVRCAGLHQGIAEAAANMRIEAGEDPAHPKTLLGLVDSYVAGAAMTNEIAILEGGVLSQMAIADLEGAIAEYQAFLEPYYRQGNVEINDIFENDVVFCEDMLNNGNTE